MRRPSPHLCCSAQPSLRVVNVRWISYPYVPTRLRHHSSRADTVMTQDKRTLQEGYKVHITEICGSTQPERIPFSTRMGLFCGGFDSVYGVRLEGSLGVKDVKRIETFLVRDAEAQQEDIKRYYSQTARICAEIDTLSGPDLGAAIAKRDEHFNASQERRHRRLLKSLSPEGRAAVTAVLDTDIAPKASTIEINQLALWSEFPEELREAFRALCKLIPQES